MIKALATRALVLPVQRSKFEHQCEQSRIRLEKALATEREARELEKRVEDDIPRRINEDWLPAIQEAGASGKEFIEFRFEDNDPELPALRKYVRRFFGLQGYTVSFGGSLGRDPHSRMVVSWRTPRLTWLKYMVLKTFSWS